MNSTSTDLLNDKVMSRVLNGIQVCNVRIYFDLAVMITSDSSGMELHLLPKCTCVSTCMFTSGKEPRKHSSMEDFYFDERIHILLTSSPFTRILLLL